MKFSCLRSFEFLDTFLKDDMTFDNKDPGSPMAAEDLLSFPYDHTCCTVEKDVLFKMFQNRFGTGKHNDLGAPMFWKTIKNIIPGTTEPKKARWTTINSHHVSTNISVQNSFFQVLGGAKMVRHQKITVTVCKKIVCIY